MDLTLSGWRTEFVESLFYLSRITKDPVYKVPGHLGSGRLHVLIVCCAEQEWGWEVYQVSDPPAPTTWLSRT